MTRGRHHRGIDLTKFDSDNDMEISGVHVRPRGEEGVRDMPGHRYELLRRPGKLRGMRYRRRGAGGKMGRKVHKQFFFGDSNGVTDMTLDDKPTEDHDILGFKQDSVESQEETLRKSQRKLNLKNKNREKRDFEENQDIKQDAKRSLKLNIIDDKNIVKDIKRNEKMNSITLMLRKDGPEKRQTPRAINSDEISKHQSNGKVNDEGAEWINVERQLIQKEIESALRPNIRHPGFNAVEHEDRQAIDANNGETIPEKSPLSKLHSLLESKEEAAKTTKPALARDNGEQGDNQITLTRHNDGKPDSKSEDEDDLSDTLDSLRLLETANSNVPLVVNDMIKSQKQKDSGDNKEFNNFEADSARKVQDGVLIVSTRDNNQTEHVNSLEEVSSPTSALEQLSLSTKDIPKPTQLPYGSSTEIWPLTDKTNKLQSNSGTSVQEEQFQVKESEDMVHAKDKDSVMPSKRNAMESEIYKRNDEAAIQDAVLDIEKIDVDEMPAVLQQKLANSHDNVDREPRKEKYSLQDYYSRGNQMQNQEARYSQVIKNNAEPGVEDENYKLSELYEKQSPDMDLGGEYDDYGGDNYKRKRDTNFLYEEIQHNSARKLLYTKENADDNSNVGTNDEQDYKYTDIYEDGMNKRSEGDEEEEEGDPYVGKKAGYNLSKKVKQNYFDDTMLTAKSEDEYNAEQKEDPELNDDVVSDAPNQESTDAEEINSNDETQNASAKVDKNSKNSDASTTKMPECPPSENVTVFNAGDFEINTEDRGKENNAINATAEEESSGESKNQTEIANTTSATESETKNSDNSARIYDNREYLAQRYTKKNQEDPGNNLVEAVKSDDKGTYNSVVKAKLGNGQPFDSQGDTSLPEEAPFAHHANFHAHHKPQKQHILADNACFNFSYHEKHVKHHPEPMYSSKDVREEVNDGPLISSGFERSDEYDANFKRMQKRTNQNVRNLKDRFHSEEYEEPLFSNIPATGFVRNLGRESRHLGKQYKRNTYNSRVLSPFNDYQSEIAYPRKRRYVNNPDVYLRNRRSWSMPEKKQRRTFSSNIPSYAAELQPAKSSTNTKANENQQPSKETKRFYDKKETMKEWGDAGSSTHGKNQSKCFLTAEKGLNPNLEQKTNGGGVSTDSVYSFFLVLKIRFRTVNFLMNRKRRTSKVAVAS